MAPTVPFALLGAVQLTAVAAWLGLAATAVLSGLRRGVAAAYVAGALALAAADAWPAVVYGRSVSPSEEWLRAAGLAMLAAAAVTSSRNRRRGAMAGSPALPALVAPLGATAAPAALAAGAGVVAAVATVARSVPGRRATSVWLAVGLLATAGAAAVGDAAAGSGSAAVAVLAVRAAATAALLVGELLLARTALAGKLVGAIVAGVVLMAVGAVAIAGSGVAGDVQSEQSARLLSVARGQIAALRGLETRAALDAQVVAACPTRRSRCERLLGVFAATPQYFAVIDQPGHGLRVVASHRVSLTSAQLLTLAGSPVVRAALRPGAAAAGVTGGSVLLPGRNDLVAVVAAAPGRPGGATSVAVRPTFAAIYGIGLTDRYLATLSQQIGYDVSIVADGRVLASSLPARVRPVLLRETRVAGVASASAARSAVVPAVGREPTAAMVPITAPGNGDVRLATLAVSQPASKALAAQRTVLRRLVLTALGVLVLVAAFALWLSRRIADPVRRLTVAAGRVRGGDLSDGITAGAALGSRDEVGSLARAFEAMTTSLRQLTGDLRSAAEAEAALRARLETVVSAMTDGVVAVDAGRRITSANDEAVRLLGTSPTEVIGRRVADAVVVRRPDGEPLPIPARLDADGDLVTHHGLPVPVRVAVAPLPGEGGWVVTLVDRTREREVERLKTEFLSNVSHELRTPLTPIRGYAEILARRASLTDDQVAGFAGEILSSTDRMSRVVALLVDVAALDAGRVQPQVADLAVGALVGDAVAEWRQRWPDRADDLRRSVARGLPKVAVDAEWVGKALSEFVDNAVKVSLPGTRILVRAEPAGDLVRVKVCDEGPGIEPERIDELLGDFSQADASETRSLEGLGLGLGFVRRVCERFGLGLYVDSTPGSGSEWGLDLPPAAAPAPSTTPRRRRSGDRLRARGGATGRKRVASAASGTGRRRSAVEGDR